ncbi:MAG: DUF2878 domain-containing protein [Arenimonas sp.]|uniref:DUF2878 domain-containing protein n=1 Tax=Arenimonas sp. TaxID=1872635 RepID=UPI0025BFCFDC|nr:DUF2878 domain-containing protein [Arenimonas sp.]MBW8367926.1 DUF2878 domain-containing protein [Arenimonas sp.]
MNRTLRLVGNVVGYQVVWLASTAGAGQGVAWAGPLAAVLFVAAVLAFGGKARQDLRILGIALAVGLLLDSAFAASGWLVYAEPVPWTFAAPVWILALWAGFAMTLNHSLDFLRERPWMSAVFGLVGGPMAYWGAARAFDAVSFGVPLPWAMAALALGWAAAMPLLFALDQRLSPPRPQGAAA